MELLYGAFSDLDFRGVVSDTYTLIAGFVAIGIPLALQFAGQASDRYDNALLAKRLTTGKVITPNTLIVLSVFYITSGILLKVLCDPDSPIIDGKYQIVLTLISIGLFVITIVSSSWFYFRFYRRILKTTSQYIPELLKINPSRKIRLLMKVNERKENAFVIKYIDKCEFPKYVKKDYEQVSTGVEVLIEQIKNKSWDESYKSILWKFNVRVLKAYFGGFKQETPKLNETDIEFVKLYWDALLRIIRDARVEGNIEMSFSSQRYLSRLLANIIHHPQCKDITSSDFGLSEKKGIRWNTDVFEVARWQSHQGNEGIDLILECEWFGQITNVLTKGDIRFSGYGSSLAFDCLGSIWGLIAKSSPDKILSAYKNITENLPTLYGQEYYPHNHDRSLRWLYPFFSDLYDKPVGVGNSHLLGEQLHTLINGEAYVKYGEYGESRPLTVKEYEDILRSVDYKELYNKAFMLSSEFYSLKFLATLALFERWNEIGYCLDWRQPEGSKVTYCGDTFLPESTSQLAEVLFRHYKHFTDNHWFYDRHDLDTYVYRGALYLLLLLYKKYKSLGSFYSNDNLFNIRIKKRIIEGLLGQVKNIEKLDDSDFPELVNLLGDCLSNINNIEKERILTDPINKDNWYSYKSAFSRGWNEVLLSEGRQLNVLSLFQWSTSDNIQPINYTILELNIPRTDLLESSSIVSNFDVYGRHLYQRFINCLYSELLVKASNQNPIDINELDRVVVFSSKNELTKLGFNSPKRQGGAWTHQSNVNWIGIEVNSNKVLIIDIKSVYITLSVNGSDEERSPIFSYINDKNEVEVKVIAEIYFHIELEGNSACFILV